MLASTGPIKQRACAFNCCYMAIYVYFYFLLLSNLKFRLLLTKTTVFDVKRCMNLHTWLVCYFLFYFFVIQTILVSLSWIVILLFFLIASLCLYIKYNRRILIFCGKLYFRKKIWILQIHDKYFLKWPNLLSRSKRLFKKNIQIFAKKKESLLFYKFKNIP